jgi:hypothetical protein
LLTTIGKPWSIMIQSGLTEGILLGSPQSVSSTLGIVNNGVGFATTSGDRYKFMGIGAAGIVKIDATFLHVFNIFIANTLAMGHLVGQEVMHIDPITGVSTHGQENPKNYVSFEVSAGVGIRIFGK